MQSEIDRNSVTAYELMDGIRALAAILVVVSHIRNILFIDANVDLSRYWKVFYFITGFGHQAVMIFFVLSGYWIAKTVSRLSTKDDFNWIAYAIDRLSRLWIVLLPALVFSLIFDVAGQYSTNAPLYLGTQGTNNLTVDAATRLNFTTFVGNLVFLQTLIVPPFGTNGPLWSLTNEFWYYVWFPSLYLIFVKKRLFIAGCIVTTITMIIFTQLLPGFLCWLFGALLFFAADRSRNTITSKLRTDAAMICAISLFLMVISLSRMPWLSIDSKLQDIAISGCFALALFTILRSQRGYPHQLKSICRYGSKSSYSLYVTHFPLVVFIAASSVVPAHRLEPSIKMLIVFVIIALTAIGFGYLFSKFTEANTYNFRRLLNARFNKQQKII